MTSVLDEPYIAFDRAKLKAVVHYVCGRCEPRELGTVRLNKILYLADMLHFIASSRPLTGAGYVKQSFGPAATQLPPVLKALAGEGKLRIEERDYFGFRMQDFIAVGPAVAADLSNEQQALLQDVVDFVMGRAVNEIGELNTEIACRHAAIGERIPYAAALAFEPAAVSEADVAWAEREVRRLRPLVEAERRESAVL